MEGDLAAAFDLVNDCHDDMIDRAVLGDVRLPCARTCAIEDDLSKSGANRIDRYDQRTFWRSRKIRVLDKKEFEALKFGILPGRNHRPDYFSDVHGALLL